MNKIEKYLIGLCFRLLKHQQRLKLIPVAGLIIFPFMLAAQDIHFSQFYASPLTLNPAMTGDYIGDWRVMNNYRRQWGALGEFPFNTLSLGYDQQLYVHNERFSLGAILVNDKSGDARLTANKFMLSVAYHKKINGHRLSFGLQPGVTKKNFTIDQLTFPDQWDRETGGFNTDIPNNEASLGDQMTYFDFNLGAGWSRKFGRFEPKAGLAIYHLNRPNESFGDAKEKLPMRKVLSVGGTYELTDKTYMMPHLLYMSHSRANNFLIGSNIGYKLPENKIKAKAAFAGLLFRDGIARNSDAFIVITGMNFKNVDVGLSYDVNVSGLNEYTNGRGGFEISIIYTSLSTVLTKTTIPCDRL